MAKIDKKEGTNKPHSPKLTDIYKSLNSDIEALKAFGALYYNIEFDNKGQCLQDSSLSICYNQKSNKYFLFNRSANQRSAPNGDIQHQINLLANQRNPSNPIGEQHKIIESLGYYSSTNTTSKKKQKHRRKYKPKAKGEQRSKFPIFATYNDELGKSVALHLEHKTGANIATLEKYNVKPIKERFFVNGNSYTHSPKHICFGYAIGDSIVKAKQPFSKKYKYQLIGTKRAKQSYIFGYKQLPKTGKALIICAGEDDAICLNHHLNKLGIYAISLYTEKSGLKLEKVRELRKRFKTIYVLYDNDSTGIEFSQKLAFQNGFVWVDFKSKLDQLGVGSINDICNLYKANKANFTSNIINTLKANNRLPKYKDDPFSIEVPHCYVINFDNYLTDRKGNVEQLTSYIQTHQYTLLQSAAGTGKSWGFMKVAEQLLKTGEYDRIIKIVPTLSICGQISNSALEQMTCNVFELKGGGVKSDSDFHELRDSDVIISTFDSVSRVPVDEVKRAVIFVDEAHQLPNDVNYRHKAMIALYKYLKAAKRVCYMTATPNYLFFSDLVKPYLGDIKLIIGRHRLDNRINTYIHTEVKNKKYARAFLEERVCSTEESTICAKMDNSQVLESFVQMDSKRGIESDYFTSKDSQRSKDNDNYNAIQETGLLNTPLQRLYYTTLMEAGVSFKFGVSAIVVFDTKAACKLIQLATRARYNAQTSINKEIEFHILLSQNKHNSNKKFTSQQRLKWYIDNAKDVAEGKNDLIDGKAKLRLNSDVSERFTYKDDNGIWQVSIFDILHQIFKEQQNEQTPELLAKRLRRYDNRFKIIEIAPLTVDKDQELKKLLDESKLSNEELKEKIYKELESESTTLITAYTHKIKNVDRKELVRNTLKLPLLNKDTVNDYIDENEKLFAKSGLDHLGKITNLLLSKVGTLGDNLNDSIREVVKHGVNDIEQSIQSKLQAKRTKLAKKQFRLESQGHQPQILSANDQVEFLRDRAIIEKVDQIKKNIQQGRRKTTTFKSIELVRIVNKAIKEFTPKPMGRNKVLKRLGLMYELKKNSKTKLYTIGVRKYQK